MSFPRYPAYKDSGVEWLGQVPEHWDVVPIKRNYAVIGGSTPQSETSAYWDGGIVWITPADLSRLEGFEIFESLRTITPEGLNSCGTTLVPKGSIVLSTRAPIGSLGIAATELCTNQGCKSIVPSSGQVSRYLAYLLSVATGELNIRGRGTTFLELSADELGAFKVGYPSSEEQVQIAAFLDRETAKIDALVAEQEKLIELLQEKRQAVISHAVTKGLDPSVPMKDSGVEWLGEVPAHWEVSALKRYWTVTDCKHVTAEFVEEGYPLASIREVQSRWIELEEAKRTTEYFYQLLIEGERKPQPGDLIFSRNATVGEIAQVHVDHPPFAMGQDVVLLRRIQQESNPDFLQLVIKSEVVVQQLALCMIGSTFKRINVEEIRSLVMAFPPPVEQNLITTYLLGQTENFDQLIAEAVLSIELLRERRTALISAAVTGQIDVREKWATTATS